MYLKTLSKTKKQWSFKTGIGGFINDHNINIWASGMKLKVSKRKTEVK